jgi:DNA-binding GntR family transcriptional regulator
MADTYFKQQAYDLIKDKILRCEYMPNSFINEKMIQEELDCSRTPIREALSRLEQEHLLKIIPKKGILISDLSINEIAMLYETRILIEPYILRNYGKAIPREKLLEFSELFSDLNPEESLERELVADDKFHNVLYQACANTYLLSCLNETTMQNQRIRILTGFTKGRINDSQMEHKAIIDQLLAQDFEKAALAMEKHLQMAEEKAFNMLISNKGWVKQEL